MADSNSRKSIRELTEDLKLWAAEIETRLLFNPASKDENLDGKRYRIEFDGFGGTAKTADGGCNLNKTIFAWTGPGSSYPAYINIKRADDGKCYVTVRSRGNGGRDQACVEVSPELLESMQCDLCAWLYRDDVVRLMATPDAEVDAELRRLGIDPDNAAQRGQKAVEGALRTVREVVELRWIVNGFLEWQEGNPCPDGLFERARAAVPVSVREGAPGDTDVERAAWLADKIGAMGDYAKEAAQMLRSWPGNDRANQQEQ